MGLRLSSGAGLRGKNVIIVGGAGTVACCVPQCARDWAREAVTAIDINPAETWNWRKRSAAHTCNSREMTTGATSNRVVRHSDLINWFSKRQGTLNTVYAGYRYRRAARYNWRWWGRYITISPDAHLCIRVNFA